jgi:hypothetical protein
VLWCGSESWVASGPSSTPLYAQQGLGVWAEMQCVARIAALPSYNVVSASTYFQLSWQHDNCQVRQKARNNHGRLSVALWTRYAVCASP